MAKYPTEASSPTASLVTEIEWKTITSAFSDESVEKRKQKWLYPKRNVEIKYKYLSLTEAAVIWNFYLARKGSFSAFNFFFRNSAAYTGEYVGTGDGSETVFNLPADSSASYTVYIDGTAQTGGGANYTFGDSSGADGADKVAFITPPASGQIITYDFTGYLKIQCRFNEDIYSFEIFYNRLVTSGLKLKGLLNA